MWWPVSGKQYRVFMDADDGPSPGGDADEGKDLPDFLQDKDKSDDDITDDESKGLATKKKAAAKTKDDEPTGERPPNVPEKFWDTEGKAIRTDSLLESYVEAESALSRSRAEKNIPEFHEGYLDVFTFDSEGQLRYGEGVDKLPAVAKDDPLLQNALKSFHKHGLSADQAAGVIKDFFVDANAVFPEPFDNEAFTAQQQEILGKNHEVQVETAQGWIQSLHSQGVLNTREAKAMHNRVGESADGIMAINKIRSMVTGEAPISVRDPIPEDGIPTKSEWYDMKLSEQYQTDEKFQKKVDDLTEVVFQGTGNTDFGGLGLKAIDANEARKRLAKSKNS